MKIFTDGCGCTDFFKRPVHHSTLRMDREDTSVFLNRDLDSSEEGSQC
jgi:hypothetical protein